MLVVVCVFLGFAFVMFVGAIGFFVFYWLKSEGKLSKSAKVTIFLCMLLFIADIIVIIVLYIVSVFKRKDIVCTEVKAMIARAASVTEDDVHVMYDVAKNQDYVINKLLGITNKYYMRIATRDNPNYDEIQGWANMYGRHGFIEILSNKFFFHSNVICVVFCTLVLLMGVTITYMWINNYKYVLYVSLFMLIFAGIGLYVIISTRLQKNKFHEKVQKVQNGNLDDRMVNEFVRSAPYAVVKDPRAYMRLSLLIGGLLSFVAVALLVNMYLQRKKPENEKLGVQIYISLAWLSIALVAIMYSVISHFSP